MLCIGLSTIPDDRPVNYGRDNSTQHTPRRSVAPSSRNVLSKHREDRSQSGVSTMSNMSGKCLNLKFSMDLIVIQLRNQSYHALSKEKAGSSHFNLLDGI